MSNHLTGPGQRDRHLAQLLGITPEEFAKLRHGGLQEVTDSEAQIYKYFIQFREDNPADILDKMDLDAHHTVYFSAREFHHEPDNES